MNLEVKIKRIHDDALLPMQANPGDAGMDLYSIETTHDSIRRSKINSNRLTN